MKIFQARCLTSSIHFVIVALFFSGCSLGKDSVVFVTKTSVGVDVDTRPPTLDIGFDRVEGTVAPVSDNGRVLPVMAGFSSDLGIVNQAIGQSFATGNAAIIVSQNLDSTARHSSPKNIDPGLINGIATLKAPVERKRYFFGTNTSFAFRVNFGVETGGIPDSLSLGYKRKEFAYVPLIDLPGEVTASDPTPTPKIALPALLATSGLKTSAESFRSAKVIHSQFFATGKAANYLASLPGIRAVVAPEIMPEAKEVTGFVSQHIKRNEGFIPQNERAKLIAKMVDNLADDEAAKLNADPVNDPNGAGAIKFLESLRTDVMTDERERVFLKRRIQRGSRTKEVLDAWEARLKASPQKPVS